MLTLCRTENPKYKYWRVLQMADSELESLRQKLEIEMEKEDWTTEKVLQISRTLDNRILSYYKNSKGEITYMQLNVQGKKLY